MPWVDNHGFLNKVDDTSTGLIDVGARWYDLTAGQFVSLGPLFEANDPQALNGYSYSVQDPINASESSGERPCPKRVQRSEPASSGGGSTCWGQGGKVSKFRVAPALGRFHQRNSWWREDRTKLLRPRR